MIRQPVRSRLMVSCEVGVGRAAPFQGLLTVGTGPLADEDEETMITFHNDHLVPPILCEILYGTIPVDWHIPVVFLTRPLTDDADETYPLGGHFPNEPRHIELYLNNVFESALGGGTIRIGSPAVRLWYELLVVAFHEFGHEGNAYLNALPEGAYEAGGLEKCNAEQIAEGYADSRIEQLADWDKRLFQPHWLGYLSVSLERRLVRAMQRRWSHLSRQCLTHYRCWKSGRQLTAGDVASLFGIRRGNNLVPLSNTEIRRVANDLAYKYTDNAGRQHLLFDFGDLREIARRIERLHVRGYAGSADHMNPANYRVAQARLPCQMGFDMFSREGEAQQLSLFNEF